MASRVDTCPCSRVDDGEALSDAHAGVDNDFPLKKKKTKTADKHTLRVKMQSF